MTDTINILFLGGAKRVSVAESFVAAGKSLGKQIAVFSYELDKFVPIGSMAEIIIGLKWNDENVIAHLQQVVKEKNIHIILPFVDPATVLAAKLKDIVPDVFIPVSDVETCRIFFDKGIADEWFRKQGFAVPSDTSGFPLIAKPRKGSASQGLTIIRSAEELAHFKQNNKSGDFLIQKYLVANEYSVDAHVSTSGEAIFVVPRKRLEVGSGEVTKSVTIKDKEIIEISKRVISLVKFRGPITLQFLREKENNSLTIMEINPRFGGGVVTSIHAGADSCLMLLKEYLGQQIEVIDNWKENLVMTRAYREFYYYADNN
ncbi:MAG: ATP-grasp protein [Bacteroidetes bacterium]|jgi:carbamoyl-phosphate synthase large subunit|nr:ATP-grasp protein [Bacteroidota bacterium]